MCIAIYKPEDKIISKDWTAILNKDDPLTLMAVGTEPIYRMLVNTWLISYFAKQPLDTLRSIVA